MQTKISLPILSPWTVLVRSALVCVMLAVVLLALSIKRIEPLPLNREAPRFDAENAYTKMRNLAKKFPNRVTWSPTRARAADWLRAEFQAMGYSPKTQKFSEMIAGKQYTDLENIYAEKKGSRHPNEIVVVMAHYDITDTTVEGAMDDASGVGVVLELARVFAKESSDRTLVFVLTDSEEFGAFWGARAFTQSYENTDQIVATLNFDFIAAEKQTKILTLCDGLKEGYTPLWLREIALNSIRSFGAVKALDLVGIEEFVERAMQIPPADHGPLLAAGIPAFNWVGQTDSFTKLMGHYHHTPHDVAEAMELKSFQDYGFAAERVIRTLNELPRIPANFRDSSYWKISKNYTVSGFAATLFHILAFIPFLAYSLTKFGRTLRSSSKTNILRTFRSEALNVAILLGSLLIGYGVILMLPALHIITQYETFPATQKSLLLYTPNFVAILLVVASVWGVHWLFNRIFSKTQDPERHPEIRHALHALFLTLIICLAFFKNSYLGVLLLLPPAYFWTALRNRKRTEDRILNGLLVLGGSLTFVALAVVLSTVFHVGVFYWYIFLAAAYGLISAYTVVLFFMALTVMIRLFRSFVL